MKQQTGAVTIPLSKPIDIDGAKVSSLQMREPTVGDQLAMESLDGSAGQKEVAIFAMLCMVKPEDLHGVSLRDYGKLQKAFSDFL